MIKNILILLILFIVNLEASSKEKITLQLDWLNQFQFAGYYIAKEKGYYDENNLDVQINEYSNNIDVINNTIKNDGFYAIGKSSLILDKLDGKDIVLLSSIFQNSPLILITNEQSQIKSIKDLKNKKIMITSDAKSSASISAMIIANELKMSDVNIQEHSFNLDDLINGKTDAMACYLSNEPYILKNKNIKFNILDPKDFGFDFYEGILFTSENELKNHPQRVEKFNKASLKGWKYAFDNIEESAKIIYEKFNTQNKSLKSLIYEGTILKELSQYEKNALGNINIDRINEIQRVYSLLGLKNKKNTKLDNLIYNSNNLYLTKEEVDYLKNNTLKFLTDSNFRPFTMKIDKNLSGIEIEYVKLIENILNKKIDFDIEDSNINKLNKMKEDKNTFKYLYSQLDLNNNFIETDTITSFKVAIATHNNKPFLEDTIQLENKSLAISKYSSLTEKLKSIYPKIKFIETKNIQESFDLLSQEKVYGVVAKLPVLSYYINNHGLTNIKISGTIPELFEMKFLINKDNLTLKNILNKVINQINEEEKYKINTKFNLVKYETYIDYSWVYKIIIPLILIIIFILLVNNKLSKEILKRKKVEERLNQIINIDSLTKIYNRRKIEEIYEIELNRVKRYKHELSIIFFDIDDFKNINDSFGHHNGDEILTKISALINDNIRKTDFIGRWGGDEFLIILPETSKNEAKIVVDTLEKILRNHDFGIKNLPKISCSFGISEYSSNDTFDSLLTKADDEMYKIKRERKNISIP